MANAAGGAPKKGSPVGVDIVGLRDFQRELRKLGPEFPAKLKAENLNIAEDIAIKAKAKALSLGGVRAKAAGAISARAEQRYASIRIDASKRGKYPFALGAEFGTLRQTQGKKIPVNSHGPRKHYGGFGPWRGNQWVAWGSSGVGYFLHPTIRDNRENIMKSYEQMIDRLARQAFNR